MPGDILEIVNKSGTIDDIEAIIAEITKLDEKITSVSGNILKIKVELQGAESLDALTAATKQYQQAAQDLGVVQKQNLELEKQRITLSEQYGATITENAETLAYLKLDLQRTEQAIRALNYAIKEGKGNQEALTQRLIEQTEQQVVLRQAINTTTAAMRQQTDIGLDKQAKKDAIATQKHAESQIQLYNSLSAVRREMIKLEMSGQKMSAEYAALAVRAKQLSQAQIEVNNETKGALPIFTRFGDLFERMGLRIIASLVWWSAIGGAIALVYEWMTKLDNAAELAGEKFDEYTDKFKNLLKSIGSINSEISAESDFVTSKLKSQIAILKDHNLTLDQRFRAYKAIQANAPAMLDDMDKEGFKTAENTKRMQDQISMMNKYVAKQEEISIGRQKQQEILRTQKENEREQKEIITSLFGSKTPTEKQLNDALSIAESGHGTFGESEQYKQLVRLRELRQQKRDILDPAAKTANTELAQKDLEKAKMEGNTKDPKPKKDNAKDMNAELESAKRVYELQLQINKQKFDESNKTFTEQKQHIDENTAAAKEYSNAVEVILENWKGKTGESLDKFIARLADNTKFLIEQLNKAKEDDDKLQQQIIKGHIKANEESEKYIKTLRDQRTELEKIMIDLNELKKSSASSHDYASGIGGILEGLGLGDGSFRQSQKQHDIAIDAQREKLDLAKELQANEGVKGSKANPIELGKLTQNVADEELNLEKLKAAKQAEIDEKILEHKKEIGKKTIELAKEIVSATKQIAENEYAGKLKQLDIQQRNVELHSEQEMRAIDAKTEFSIQKDNEKALVAAQTAAKENELQQKRNNLELKKAIADKQMAEAQILMSTAVAEIKVIAALAGTGPEGLAIGIAEAAIIAAIGAAQYAAASSTPLPQFEKGGITETPHFIAAEGNKPELIIAPSGDVSLASKEGIYTAPVGSTVKNASDTEKLLKYAINGIGINGMSMGMLMEQRTKQMTDKKIVEKLDEVSENIIRSAYIGRVIKNEVVIKENYLQKPTRK